MKLRTIFTSLVSAAALLFATGCVNDEELGDLGVIKVDKTYVTVPMTGGSATIAVSATEAWSFDQATIPAGVTVNPTSGNAGETNVTFTSASAVKDIKAEIKINCGTKTQYINFFQAGDPALKPKFDDFVAGDYWIMFKTSEKWLASKPANCEIDNSGSYCFISCVDAAGSYEAGLTSTAANVFSFEAVEGGFAIKDSEGGYIYMDAAGKYNNFYRTSKVASATVWTVQQITDTEFEVTSDQGKWIQYSVGYSTWGAYSSKQDGAFLPYLVPAKDPAPEVLKIETTTYDVPKEGGDVKVAAVINADNVKAEYSESWIHYYGTDAEGLVFSCDANEGGARSASVTVKAALGDFTGESVITINQAGSIIDATAAEINAAEDGTTQYRITGVVSKVASDVYGNIYIKDYSGEVYVYGVLKDGASKVWASLGVKEGDIITVTGAKTSYNGAPQIKNAEYVSHVAVKDITAADFNALADDADAWYRLTGTVTDGTAQSGHKFDLATYGNFDLVDATGDVYVYGITTGYNGPAKAAGELGLAAGDVITLIAHKGSYKDAPQAAGAFFLEKASSETPGEGENPGTGSDSVVSLTNAEILAAMTGTDSSYSEYTIASASGNWTVNACRLNTNTFLQSRGKRGGFVKTPAFDKDIKSVTIHFSHDKSVFANNVYCAFPSSWTAPTDDAQYPEDGNVGKATTAADSYELTIPVEAGNKQVCISIIGTYSYYLESIDVAF